MLTSISYVWRLPHLLISTLLDFHLYLMKILEVTLTLIHNFQDIIFGCIVAYGVIFGDSSYVDLQCRNTRAVAINIKLYLLVRIVL